MTATSSNGPSLAFKNCGNNWSKKGSNMEQVKRVYSAINAVQAALAVEGISKDRKNNAQGYNFRGIDDVFNALSPLLAKNKLCILPRIINRDCQERVTQKGGTMFYVTVEAEFDLVSAEDGSVHTIRTFGEAQDSGDKATNKAMSAAYKYAAFQAFAIPTEGDNDADAHTPPPSSAKQGMSGPEIAKHESAINGAKTLDELKTAFAVAYESARVATDKASADLFTKLKDNIKARIEAETDVPQ